MAGEKVRVFIGKLAAKRSIFPSWERITRRGPDSPSLCFVSFLGRDKTQKEEGKLD